MPPCHATPFLRPGITLTPNLEPPREEQSRDQSPAECCDYCGSLRLEWRKCKLICADCRQINKSCADL
jgi:hypothetical protein